MRCVRAGLPVRLRCVHTAGHALLAATRSYQQHISLPVAGSPLLLMKPACSVLLRSCAAPGPPCMLCSIGDPPRHLRGRGAAVGREQEMPGLLLAWRALHSGGCVTVGPGCYFLQHLSGSSAPCTAGGEKTTHRGDLSEMTQRQRRLFWQLTHRHAAHRDATQSSPRRCSQSSVRGARTAREPQCCTLPAVQWSSRVTQRCHTETKRAGSVPADLRCLRCAEEG